MSVHLPLCCQIWRQRNRYRYFDPYAVVRPFLSAAEDKRPRNYLSCCCSCWIFCFAYALSTPTTCSHYFSLLLLSFYHYLSLCLPCFLSIYLSITLYLTLSIYHAIYLSRYLSLYLSIYLYYLSIYLFTYLPMYLFIYLPMYLSIYLSIYRSITISICHSINWNSIATDPGAGIGLVGSKSYPIFAPLMHKTLKMYLPQSLCRLQHSLIS